MPDSDSNGTVPVGIKPRASHHRSPRGRKKRKRQRSTDYRARTGQSFLPTLDLFQRHISEDTSERRSGAHVDFPEAQIAP